MLVAGWLMWLVFGICFVFGRWVLVCVVCWYFGGGWLFTMFGVFCFVCLGWHCCCCLGCIVYGVGLPLIVLL